MVLKQRAITKTAAAALVLMGLCMPVAGYAIPCTCDDVKKIEDTLKTIRETRDAWLDVLASIFDDKSDAPNNMDEAIASFHKRMGWTSVRKVGGVNKFGDAVLDPQFVRENCDSIVEGVRVHEHTHTWFTAGHGLQAVFSDPRDMAAMLAKSEIWARDREEAFLKGQLEDIRKNCNYKCTITGKLFKSLPVCIAECPDRRTLGHMDICTKQ